MPKINIYDDTKISPKKKDEFFKQIVNKLDGTVAVYDPTTYQVIAIKNDLNRVNC